MRLAKWLFYLSILVWIGSWFFLDRLPEPNKINHDLYAEPLQTSLSEPKFEVSYNGQKNTVQPVDNYEIWGVIVSHNDPDKWYSFDLTHDEKSIDTRDLCIVWGDNLKTDDYRKVSYLNNDWSCEFHWGQGVQFNANQLSNNHLITDNEAVRKAIAHLNIGDQIHIKGKLVDYTQERWQGWVRHTSTTRTDTGNGACEIIFVESVEVINSYNHLWVMIHKIAFWILLGMLVLRCWLFFRTDEI